LAGLQQQIASELVTATKSRDAIRVSTLRLLISAFRYKEVEKKRDLNEGEQLEVIAAEAKKRKEAVASYTQGGRTELAAKEQAELDILNAYLPKALTESEIEALVRQAIATANAQSAKDMGKVMGILMPQIKGRADGKQVQQLVQKLLTAAG
jgi:uncharacterized protein YqeY